MRKDLLPHYFRGITLRGFEDETPEQKAAREAAEAEDHDDDEEESGGDKDKPEGNDALKSALQKERKAAKDAQRALKLAQKRLDEIDSKDKSETEKAKEDKAKADSKAQKLAARLKEVAVDNAIIKIGGSLKFRDIDDALKLVSRELIEVDQDEDDPAEVEVTESTVKAALEKLAKAKPHLIVADGQEDRSGSKFNGGGRKSNKEMDEEDLKKRYPALARSVHTT